MKQIAIGLASVAAAAGLYEGARRVVEHRVEETDRFGAAGAGEIESDEHGDYKSRTTRDFVLSAGGGLGIGVLGVTALLTAAIGRAAPNVRFGLAAGGLVAAGLGAGLLTGAGDAGSAWLAADYRHDPRSRPIGER